MAGLLKEPLVSRAAGVGLHISRFWRLARQPKAVFEYNCWLMHNAVRSSGVELRDRRVLDVACGSRQIAVQRLWQEAALRVGLDGDISSLRANDAVETAVCGDVHAIPFDDESFGVVVSVDTIEHSQRPSDFLQEIARVLAPGGVGLIFTPHLWGYKTLTAKIGGPALFHLAFKVFYGTSVPYDAYYRANTARALDRLAKGANLQLRQVVYIPEIPHFFYRSRLASSLAFAFNASAERLGMAWLQNYVLAVVGKE